MTLRTLAAGVPFAALLITFALAFTSATHAEEARRDFVSQRLGLGSQAPAFELAPETWSKSVQDLAALLERVRLSRIDQGRVVTLADAIRRHEHRHRAIGELEPSLP